MPLPDDSKQCNCFTRGVYRRGSESKYRCIACKCVVDMAYNLDEYKWSRGYWWLIGSVPDPRPKCARCETRFFVLDAESVCPECREVEVERDDGC